VSGHDDPAAAADRDLEDLEERTEKLGSEISQAKADLVDPGGDSKLDNEVEGAVGDHPERSDDEPEAEGAPKGWA
jgi:hypothetical protein